MRRRTGYSCTAARSTAAGSDGQRDRFSASIVFDRRNRMHVQKAILLLLLGSGMRTMPGGAIMLRKCFSLFRRLDTSIIIPWLKENYNCDVIAMIADVARVMT